jgi:guanosine-3',5'-bis(diphosphate) 3'-pyrophosphohydrolase
MEACRNRLQELVNDNPVVMEKFDDFISNLLCIFSPNDPEQVDHLKSILKGIQFGAECHQGQNRRDEACTPYIIHPIRVANYLCSLGDVQDHEVIIAALLHDTIEDTDATFDEICGLFGQGVANYVKETTDDRTLSKQERKRLQIHNAPHKSIGAAQIKLADKLDNLYDCLYNPPVQTAEVIDQYFIWAKLVVEALPKTNAQIKLAIEDTIAAYWQLRTSS